MGDHLVADHCLVYFVILLLHLFLPKPELRLVVTVSFHLVRLGMLA